MELVESLVSLQTKGEVTLNTHSVDLLRLGAQLGQGPILPALNAVCFHTYLERPMRSDNLALSDRTFLL